MGFEPDLEEGAEVHSTSRAQGIGGKGVLGRKTNTGKGVKVEGSSVGMEA